MKIDVTKLINTLDEQALLYGESKATEHHDESIRLQLTANCLRKFRDTLISIANCQAGVASHTAKKTLIETGHCAHESSKFVVHNEAQTSKWQCLACDKESDERLMPFE